MPVPQVTTQKTDGNTGVVRPGTDGILAIIGPSSAGTKNLASSQSKKTPIASSFGVGKLPELAAMHCERVGRSVVLVRAEDSVAGTYGTATETGVGTAVLTAGASEPLDDYDLVIKFIVGGTRGVAGITYTYSLDGGLVTSQVQALGVATSIVIPNSGITINIAAGTILANQTYSAKITGPRMNNADLVAALEALRLSTLPFEAVQVLGPADATMFTTLDTWLAGREAEGRYYFGILNAAHRDPATQTEAQYKTALDSTWIASTSTRITLCADATDLVSVYTGLTHRRDVASTVAQRLMSIDLGVDAAEVALGPVVGGILAVDGNPKWHNEELYPGLDDSRFTVLRTLDGVPTYINNPNLFSPPGSDYVYVQHTRTMNAACSVAKELLTKELSRGVRKQKKKVGPLEIAVIAEDEAARIEQMISAELARRLNGQVNAVGFIMSRDDDISSNAGATIHGDTWLQSLAYIKKFATEAKFVRTVPVSL